LHSTPIEPGIIIPMNPKDPKFKQKKNYVNYSFEKNVFYSWPMQLFESFSYKPVFSTIYRFQTFIWRMWSFMPTRWKVLKCIYFQSKVTFKLYKPSQDKSTNHQDLQLDNLSSKKSSNTSAARKLTYQNILFYLKTFKQLQKRMNKR